MTQEAAALNAFLAACKDQGLNGNLMNKAMNDTLLKARREGVGGMVFNRNDAGVVIVSAPNGVKAGEIIMMEDGYWQFWPDAKGGYWPAWSMRQIADEVDSMNEAWDAEVETALSSMPRA